MMVPEETSWLMTSVNSFRASPLAAVEASFESRERRASDSTIRSSTTSWPILAALCGVIDGSKAVTFAGMLTLGIGGSTQIRADTATGSGGPAGGSAAPAALVIQAARLGPELTLRTTVGEEPSGSSGAGWGLWVERLAATGRLSVKRRTRAMVATTGQNVRRRLTAGAPGSRCANARVRAKRRAHAMTRLPRIAVLVQNSSVVGPSNTTASNATTTPNTILATGPSGTVLGSGIMNSAKISTSGEVKRTCQSSNPHMGVACQLATMQWSGMEASAR